MLSPVFYLGKTCNPLELIVSMELRFRFHVINIKPSQKLDMNASKKSS